MTFTFGTNGLRIMKKSKKADLSLVVGPPFGLLRPLLQLSVGASAHVLVSNAGDQPAAVRAAARLREPPAAPSGRR